MHAVADDVTVAGRDLLAIVDEWLARGHRLYVDLTDRHAKLIHELRRGDRERVGFDTADRLLVAIGMEYRLAEIAPPPRTGSRSRTGL